MRITEQIIDAIRLEGKIGFPVSTAEVDNAVTKHFGLKKQNCVRGYLQRFSSEGAGVAKILAKGSHPTAKSYEVIYMIDEAGASLINDFEVNQKKRKIDGIKRGIAARKEKEDARKAGASKCQKLTWGTRFRGAPGDSVYMCGTSK